MLMGFQIPMWRFMGAPNSTRSTSGTQTVPIPAGANFALIHCQGFGGNGGAGSLNATGGSGGGGAYARVNAKDVSTLTALYFDINTTATRVRENNSSGTIICAADAAGPGSDQSGPPATQGFAGAAGTSGSGNTVGDVKFSGAAGSDGTVAASFPGPSGGGAAGSSGAASGNSGGPGDPAGGGGGPSESGGSAPGGGGAGASSFNPAGSNPGHAGADGYIRVVWS